MCMFFCNYNLQKGSVTLFFCSLSISSFFLSCKFSLDLSFFFWSQSCKYMLHACNLSTLSICETIYQQRYQSAKICYDFWCCLLVDDRTAPCDDTDLINGSSDWISSLGLRLFQRDFMVQNFERSQILWFYCPGAQTQRFLRGPRLRTWCPTINK